MVLGFQPSPFRDRKGLKFELCSYLGCNENENHVLCRIFNDVNQKTVLSIKRLIALLAKNNASFRIHSAIFRPSPSSPSREEG